MKPPATALPLPRQLAWADIEFGMFNHFGPNTYLDQEWGDGAEDPAVVNPAEFDPRQWARAAREAGMRYLVFTAKHHDGFCNWPTDTTDHCLRSSPWQGGRGDMVELVAQACAAEGLLLGIYCSPWDRHEPSYADPPAYDDLYCRQWRELLTRYGDVFCVWLDGAGSEGHVYNWQMIMDTVRDCQPETCIFSIGEPDYRWAGNEDGLAPYPCWNTLEHPEDYLGHDQFFTRRFAQSFPRWLPAECDARLRQNWFWNSYDLPTLKSTERLVDMYYQSVGRGCNLMLNVGPDPRGLLPEPDVERLRDFGRELRRRFATPLASAGSPPNREPAPCCSGAPDPAPCCPDALAENLPAGAVEAAPDGTRYDRPAPGVLEVRFPTPTTVNTAVVCEDLSAGERVRVYSLQALIGDRWEGVYAGTALGHKQINTFAPVTAQAFRLHAARSDGEPRLRSLEVFHL